MNYDILEITELVIFIIIAASFTILLAVEFIGWIIDNRPGRKKKDVHGSTRHDTGNDGKHNA